MGNPNKKKKSAINDVSDFVDTIEEEASKKLDKLMVGLYKFFQQYATFYMITFVEGIIQVVLGSALIYFDNVGNKRNIEMVKGLVRVIETVSTSLKNLRKEDFIRLPSTLVNSR